MIKAIIFDCFGVLIADTYKQRLAELDVSDPEKAQQVRAINHASDLGMLSREESSSHVAEILGIDVEELLEQQDQGEVRNQELLDFIATLQPRFKVGLLSNVSSRERLGIRFEQGQLDSLFNTVVASGDEGYVKPQPELYTIVATRLGVQPSECVMIDDIAAFCDGATAVGMQAIQFISTNQCITDLNSLIDRGGQKA